MYSKDNIARVRRDEAKAKADEEEEGRRQQETDAIKRIELLRGQRTSCPSRPQDVSRDKRDAKPPSSDRHRKRRRLAGEDDTDRDIRFAREDVLQRNDVSRTGALTKPMSDAPLMDASGHVSLFPGDAPSRAEKNAETEAETAKKKRELEDQYTMRFSNAAGYKQGMEAPWYSTSTRDLAAQTQGVLSKDVWGNEDPRRQEREQIRLSTNDPLAAMKKGVRQLREVEKERKKWNDERQRELEALRQEDKKLRRRRRDSRDSLDGFTLDDDSVERERRGRRRRSQKEHPHRDHSRSRRDEHCPRRERYSSRHHNKHRT